MHPALSSFRSLALVATLLSTAHAAPDAPAQGEAFSHADWDLVCDNTRTCRAAGYSADNSAYPVSMLLTRPAGPHQPVTALVALGRYGDEEEQRVQAVDQLQLRVNGQALGALPWLSEPQRYGLTDRQLRAVLKALPRPHARIEFTHGRTVWAVSDQGATAVLLKMDDVQGRVGTPGALARPGKRPEREVRPALPRPVVTAARVPNGQGSRHLPGLSAPAMSKLRQALLGDAGDRRDVDLLPPDAQGFEFHPLSGGQWLASTLCWRAAYNEGYCMWVVNERAPHQPRFITEMASGYDHGEIHASQKGRGLGDCWDHEHWTWTGQAFVQTAASTSGRCALIEPGGAWDLPTRVSKVVRP